MTDCEHCGAYTPERGLFCGECGKLKEAGSLKGLRIEGFTGAQSTSPKIEKFLDTGDPDHLV